LQRFRELAENRRSVMVRPFFVAIFRLLLRAAKVVRNVIHDLPDEQCRVIGAGGDVRQHHDCNRFSNHLAATNFEFKFPHVRHFDSKRAPGRNLTEPTWRHTRHAEGLRSSHASRFRSFISLA
jgi:hypothetical protein